MTRQAYSLDVLLAEINAHAPKRSKKSDGGLASPQHTKQNPGSDHEPNKAGVWTARDFTHDPKGGLNCNELATLLVREFGKHPAMKAGSYIIWNGRIISYNRLAEAWREYKGGNPHTKHLHVSVSDSATGYDSRVAWDLWAHPTPHLDDAIAALDKALGARKASDPDERRLRIARAGIVAVRRNEKAGR